MDVLDKFFKKYSYKFTKGYPDMNNKQDVLLLESILDELGINSLNEVGLSTSYNDLITKKLGNLPVPQGDYILGENVNVNGEDGNIFKQLYSVAPPKKNSTDDIETYTNQIKEEINKIKKEIIRRASAGKPDEVVSKLLYLVNSDNTLFTDFFNIQLKKKYADVLNKLFNEFYNTNI